MPFRPLAQQNARRTPPAPFRCGAGGGGRGAPGVYSECVCPGGPPFGRARHGPSSRTAQRRDRRIAGRRGSPRPVQGGGGMGGFRGTKLRAGNFAFQIGGDIYCTKSRGSREMSRPRAADAVDSGGGWCTIAAGPGGFWWVSWGIVYPGVRGRGGGVVGGGGCLCPRFCTGLALHAPFPGVYNT